MYKTSKLIGVVVSASLLFTSFQQGNSGTASAQEIFTAPVTNTVDQTGIRPLDTDAGSLYYYASGQKIPLEPSTDWVSVTFASADQAEQSLALGRAGLPLGALDEAHHIPNPDLLLIPLKKGVSVQDLVAGINSMRAMNGDFVAVNPVFKTANSEMAITDQFIATFSATKSPKAIQAINASYGVEIVEPILGQENTYILRLSADSHFDALAISNLYQENGIAISAAPNFVRMMKADPSKGKHADKAAATSSSNPGPSADPNDFFYSDQWAWENTQQYGLGMVFDADIDATEAWDITVGDSSIIIAVVDEGVDFNHEDLSTVGGYDATGGGNGGFPSGNDAHGTNVAGLAAAIGNNSIGVSGVCQQCRIMPIRIAYNNAFGNWVTHDSWAANGITWAYQNGASIINNSWYFSSPSTVITTAISNAKTLGRGGKGSVVVAAAGNFNSATVVYPANLSTVIAVGASNMCDQRKTSTNDGCNGNEYWWGSSYGNELDISAPGVWLDSTDIMGSAGYSSGGFYGPNYFGFMNGTSGASPIVAGVAGLILSLNPNLTADEVQTILQNTADDVNGGGWDATMGYGRVNAYAAVLEAIAFNISGNVGVSGVTLSYTDGTLKTVTSLADGSYSLWVSENWSGTVTPSHACYTFNPTNPSYVNVISDQTNEDYVRTPVAGCADINVNIGGISRGTYGLPSQAGFRVNYTGLDSGPVKVASSNSVSIIAAIREAWAVNGVTTSFSQLMGLPLSQVSDTYVFPAYNNVSLNEQLRIGNVDTVATQVTVTIGGVLRGTYDLDPDEAVRINYPGLDSGPVVVEGTDGVDIIAAIREAWLINGQTRSFVQLMGLPSSQLSDKYVFPAYNNVTLNEQLRIGNVDTVATQVTVTIGGVLRGTYDLDPAEAVRINYAGLDSGPVIVDGTDGVNIISSIRDAWLVNGQTTSFSQLMGMPAGGLSDKYIFPAYNNVTLDEQLRIGNVDTVATQVTVTIGGVLRGTYDLDPAEAVRINYAGLDSGPVVVDGTDGVDIISAIREAWKVNGVTQSFVQLMGLPFEQLSTTYLFPAYNNVTLNEQLRFAVP